MLSCSCTKPAEPMLDGSGAHVSTTSSAMPGDLASTVTKARTLLSSPVLDRAVAVGGI